MTNNLFPNIKGALRGQIKEEDGQSDPLDTMDPQQRVNYLNELTKLEAQEEKLRLEIDKIKKSKEDLKKKYDLAQKDRPVTPWSKTGIQNTI